MTRLDFDPDLERLGDALHAGATIDLAHEERTTHADRSTSRRVSFLQRPRALAGGSLGLAGVGAAVLLALSGTAATSPAYAITQKSDGTVFLKINFGGRNTLSAADGMLIDKYHETVLITTAPGQATNTAPIDCAVTPDPYAAGDPTPTGPRVKLLFGKDNTFVVPSGNTGPGTYHLVSCNAYVSYPHRNTGSGNSGNSGNS